MVAMLIKLLFARDFARTLKLLHVEMSQQWAKTGHDSSFTCYKTIMYRASAVMKGATTFDALYFSACFVL